MVLYSSPRCRIRRYSGRCRPNSMTIAVARLAADGFRRPPAAMVTLQKALKRLRSERSDAGIGLIGPFLLDCITTNRFRLPGANIANLAVSIVVPALCRNRVCDSLA